MAIKPRQQEFINALFSYPTKRAAAVACGVSERTARGWLQRDDVKAAIAEAGREALRMAAARAAGSTESAVSALAGIIDDGENSARDRVAAARAVLGWALQASEAVDVESRLAELEARLRI